MNIYLTSGNQPYLYVSHIKYVTARKNSSDNSVSLIRKWKHRKLQPNKAWETSIEGDLQKGKLLQNTH